jgi:predicted metalloprotease
MKIRRRGTISDDVIDRRAETRGSAGGRGMGGFPIPGGAKGGIGGIFLMIILAIFGGSQVIGGGGGGGSSEGGLGDIFGKIGVAPATTTPRSNSVEDAPDPEADTVEWVKVVLDDIQDSWEVQFQQGGSTYERAKLVLFEDGVETGGCGFAPSQVGPFYCPADKTAYLDLSFLEELETKYKAEGDFAPAYVIAHEIGHHVQNITGVSTEVRNRQQRKPDDANDLSVRLELQADCLAGVWANSTYEEGNLEDGDFEEGLDAAAAVGDDRLQKQAGARVNPESWTHGSSEQRMKWFTRGYESGDPDSCDTFSGGI